MSVKVWLGGMVVASVLVIATSSRRAPAARAIVQPPPESPWLSREAAAQIFGPEGRMGPLFESAWIGAPAPSPAVRSRIAAFAHANNVKIDFELADGYVAAVRFDVTFGGCCGYEGVDVLARRIGRPKTWTCGWDKDWLDDWASVGEDGVYVRGHVRVNRLQVRWEHQVPLDELVERADQLLGANRATVAARAGDRWLEIEPSRQFMLEVPYRIDPYQVRYPDDLGLRLVAGSGRIVEVSFTVRGYDEAAVDDMRKVLRARWGRPRVGDDVWTWHKPDRTVTAALDSSATRVTLSLR
ncbi:MAG: hypothetical protein IPQ07_41445 [Myxococcales bacterium]|nr:hypothetical protein [Myxococcales bacterium]